MRNLSGTIHMGPTCMYRDILLVVTETMSTSVITVPQINHYPTTDVNILEIDGLGMKMLCSCRKPSIHIVCASHSFLPFLLLFNYHIVAPPGRAAFVLYSGREGAAHVLSSLHEDQPVRYPWSTLR